MWCKIPKIGSSSWANNFLDLRKRTNKKHTKNKQTKTQNTRTQGKVSTNNSSSWANNFLDLRREPTKNKKSKFSKSFNPGNVSQAEKDKRLKQPGYLHLLARDMFSSPPEQVNGDLFQIMTVMMATGLEVHEKPHH